MFAFGGLRPSAQSLDQLELMFRELCRTSLRLRGGGDEFHVIGIEGVVCGKMVGQVIVVDDK